MQRLGPVAPHKEQVDLPECPVMRPEQGLAYVDAVKAAAFRQSGYRRKALRLAGEIIDLDDQHAGVGEAALRSRQYLALGAMRVELDQVWRFQLQPRRFGINRHRAHAARQPVAAVNFWKQWHNNNRGYDYGINFWLQQWFNIGRCKSILYHGE